MSSPIFVCESASSQFVFLGKTEISHWITITYSDMKAYTHIVLTYILDSSQSHLPLSLFSLTSLFLCRSLSVSLTVCVPAAAFINSNTISSCITAQCQSFASVFPEQGTVIISADMSCGTE